MRVVMMEIDDLAGARLSFPRHRHTNLVLMGLAAVSLSWASTASLPVTHCFHQLLGTERCQGQQVCIPLGHKEPPSVRIIWTKSSGLYRMDIQRLDRNLIKMTDENILMYVGLDILLFKEEI